MDRAEKNKWIKNIGFLAMAGTVTLSLLVKCSSSGHMPDDRQARDILDWLLPDVDVFALGGQEVKLNDAKARLDRNVCWTPRGETINARRYPEPKYECVFWLTASNGQSYAMALLVQYIPESSVFVNKSGRRLDFAKVGRYDIQPLSHSHQRDMIRQHAPEYSKH